MKSAMGIAGVIISGERHVSHGELLEQGHYFVLGGEVAVSALSLTAWMVTCRLKSLPSSPLDNVCAYDVGVIPETTSLKIFVAQHKVIAFPFGRA